MSSSLARPILRRAVLRRLPGRRYETTATTATAASNAASAAASSAKAAASKTASRAQEGLSKVVSAAGPAVAGAARGVSNALGKVGGRTGRLIQFVQAQTPFVVYYAKVGLELSKLVFHGQKMSPPSLATFQTTYQNMWTSIQNRTALPSPQFIMQQIRALGTPQLVAGGVVAAECLGFFTAGEMLGRFKLVGYHGQAGGHH